MNPTKNRSENFNINYKVLEREKRLYEEKIWENNRYCDCGAGSYYECSCSLEKRKRFIRRRKKKVREKFGKRIDKAFRGQAPTPR